MPPTAESPRDVEFWIDPICPWCWVTANWIVSEVAPRRNLRITWQPISLLFKNNPEPGSDGHTNLTATLRMLRVLEAIRAELGDEAVFDWYWQCGARIHYDKDRHFDLAEALAKAGFDTRFAAAGDDESYDVEIRRRMDEGLALVGNDVGTPIIAFECPDGVKRGMFGPVITRVPSTDEALRVWDALEALTLMDGFWEFKRTRTEGPDLGQRPDV